MSEKIWALIILFFGIILIAIGVTTHIIGIQILNYVWGTFNIAFAVNILMREIT